VNVSLLLYKSDIEIEYTGVKPLNLYVQDSRCYLDCAIWTDLFVTP